MALENVYQCTQEQINQLPKWLSEAFFEHPLYRMIFPEPKTRKDCIAFYYTHYLEMLAPYAMFLADSEECNAIMVVYDSRKYERKAYWKSLFQMNVKLLHLAQVMTLRQCFHMMKEWEMLSKQWVKDFERDSYFHLEFIFTKESKRNRGIAEHMVKELIDEGDIMDMNISVDVNEKESALWYEKMGFVLMNTIVDEETDLHRYCLIARHHNKEQKSWIQSIG